MKFLLGGQGHKYQQFWVKGEQIQEDSIEQTYNIGDCIEAKIEGWDRYYPGKVISISGKGSYSVNFDDGEKLRIDAVAKTMRKYDEQNLHRWVKKTEKMLIGT